MPRYIVSICLLLSTFLYASHFQITPQEELWIEKNKTIKVSNEIDWYPYDFYEKGTARGYSIDYINLLAKIIGLDVEFITDTWPNLLKKFKNKEIDLLHPLRKTSQREELVLYSTKFITTKPLLITQLKRKEIKSLNDLTGKTLALKKDRAINKKIKEKYKNIKYVEYTTSKEMLEAVSFGLVDGAVEDYLPANYIVKKELLTNLHVASKVQFSGIADQDLYLVFQKNHSMLKELFNRAIASISEEELKNLEEKWANYEEKNITTSVNTSYTSVYLIIEFLVFLIFLGFYRQYQIKKYNLQLELLSNTDKLTGIYNRLKVDALLEYEKKLFDRFYRPISIVLFDLDFFKKVNKEYGHKVGDDVLKTVAKIIQEHKRETDDFARWSGEEFLVICHETDINGAKVVAEKFRVAIEAYKFETIKSITSSFGVAEFEKYESIEKLLNKADTALHKAKANGRNMVV